MDTLFVEALLLGEIDDWVLPPVDAADEQMRVVRALREDRAGIDKLILLAVFEIEPRVLRKGGCLDQRFDPGDISWKT
jgi:hypothetical protein